MSLRNFVFTLNNPEPLEINPLWEYEHLRYIIYGEEIGESGTPHLQGYVQLYKNVRLTTIKKLIPRAHMEQAKGGYDANYKYCTKDGKFIEKGTPIKQGQRTDLETIGNKIINRTPMRDIALEHPGSYIRYHRGFKALQTALIEPRTTKPEVLVFYGKAGTGKTRLAKQLLNEGHYVWGPAKKTWFDGYIGQEEILFDEFRGQIPLGQMLMILDRYENEVEIKGGFVQMVATKIIITSPKHPREWYENQFNDRIDQLLRRIDEITEIN